jgi:hypothetical protein
MRRTRQPEAERMKIGLAGLIVGLTATLAIVVAACGGDDGGGEVRTVTVPAVEQDVSVTGDAILIETRITSARKHMGEVLRGSMIGESPFCPGGKTSGGSTGAVITTTFRCPDGSLKVRYSPTQPSLVQGAPWEIVSGTGRYKGLGGGGSMVATFGSDDPDQGREIFTGTVGE